MSYGRLKSISKAMSAILRHNAAKHGLQLRADGYISLDDLLTAGPLKRLNATAEDVFQVVEENDKQRFELKRNENFSELWLIRAC